jgi:hypothetical protein
MQTEKNTKPSNSGMQEGDQPRMASIEDVLKRANRRQRREYERKTKGLTDEQKAELDRKIVEGNVSGGVTKAWNKAIASAMSYGIDFMTEKVYTDYISKIDEAGIGKHERDKRVEQFLSDMRLGYTNLLSRREKQKQAAESTNV